jgi:hypothetical protein
VVPLKELIATNTDKHDKDREDAGRKPYKMWIGSDILKQGKFLYNTPESQYTLIF